ASQILGITPEYATGDPILEILTPAAIDRDPALPAAFSLGQNYPNPFNGVTMIPVMVRQPAPVSLIIYNLKGDRIKALVEGTSFSGKQALSWDGTDARNQSVSSGVYFYVFTQGNLRSIRKLVLLR
ncbi:MAG: T9SS type A sorting domain-containing protein, partial [Fidelibacterota bacterium]